MDELRKTGRVTIPTDLDVVPETLEILKKWGADDIRDCDGTDFPQQLKNADANIYSTYYDRKKEAILLFGLSLWGTAIPKLKDFLESAREEEALCYCDAKTGF